MLVACAHPRVPTTEPAIEYTISGIEPLAIDVSFPAGVAIDVCTAPCRYHYERSARPVGTLAQLLLSPPGSRAAIRIRAPKSFTAALRREGEVFVGTLDDLGAPYAIGAVRAVREGSTTLDVVFAPGRRASTAPGARASTDVEILAWLARSLHSVRGYYARAPFAHALVTVEGYPRDEIFGMTDHHGEGSIGLQFGPTSRVDGDDDWVATHELLHLSFPFVGREHAWFSEGMATYVEPIARVRSGDLDVDTMWRDLARGLPKGQPGEDDEGLENTRTWARTYWGGALFYFVVDVELRIRTGNARGLEHALRALAPSSARIEDVLENADRATATTVFSDAYAKYALRAETIDLDAWFRRLGVKVTGESVTFDNVAELSAIRSAITRRVE